MVSGCLFFCAPFFSAANPRPQMAIVNVKNMYTSRNIYTCMEYISFSMFHPNNHFVRTYPLTYIRTLFIWERPYTKIDNPLQSLNFIEIQNNIIVLLRYNNIVLTKITRSDRPADPICTLRPMNAIQLCLFVKRLSKYINHDI